jgi:hypothetical protein
MSDGYNSQSKPKLARYQNWGLELATGYWVLTYEARRPRRLPARLP